MLNKREQQHHRRAQHTRHGDKPDRPPDAKERRHQNSRVNGHHDACIQRHPVKFAFRDHIAHRCCVAPRRDVPERHQVKPRQPEPRDLGQPALEIHRRVKRHLRVLFHMPGKAVMARMGVAAVQRLFHVDKRCHPKHRLIEAPRLKGRAMGGLVARRIGRHTEENPVDKHRRPHPHRAQCRPDKRARQHQRSRPLCQVDQPRPVRACDHALERAPVNFHPGRGRIGAFHCGFAFVRYMFFFR